MTSEVLPAIRQTGRYCGYSANDPDPVVVRAKLLGVGTSDVITCRIDRPPPGEHDASESLRSAGVAISIRAVRRQTSRQVFPDRRFMFMAATTPRETLDASLTRIADDLIGLRETADRMDHAQDALLVNGNSLQGQIETLSSLIAHMIEVLTPARAEQEGPSLADLLSRLVTQQAALAGLMRQTFEIVTRLDPKVSAANGAGRT